jgi:FG-GAP repeat
VRTGGAWSQLGGKLTSGENDQAQFGWSVALSADGSTALVGGNEYGVAKGAAWVYTRSGSSWAPQTKLVPNDEAGAGRFGTSVALSADGNIALVGGSSDNWAGTNTQHGAAWIFGRIGSPRSSAADGSTCGCACATTPART